MIQAIHPTPTPKANPAAINLEGNARFTILTSRLIRMEYDPLKRFEDHASQVFLYRDQPVPTYHSWKQDGWLHIETDYLHLRFAENGRFHWRDLQITLKQSGQTWPYSFPRPNQSRWYDPHARQHQRTRDPARRVGLAQRLGSGGRQP